MGVVSDATQDQQVTCSKAIAKWLNTGIPKIVDTQEDIVVAAAKSNLCCQIFQTKGTTFRLPSLLNDFGFCPEASRTVMLLWIVLIYYPMMGTHLQRNL